MLREELQLLQEPGSYVGEVVKVMSKTKVLVKARLRLRCAACVRVRARARVFRLSCCASVARGRGQRGCAAPRVAAPPACLRASHRRARARVRTVRTLVP
jgi:hypothetical protein